MYAIEITNNATASTVGVKWYINEPKARIQDKSEIVSLYADGDELAKIYLQFDNLPICTGQCIWKQPFAQFIYDNL